MGKLPSELEDAPSADVDLMLSYWQEEPWGPWRDNFHMAMVAREIRRSTIAPGKTIPPMSEWMLVQRASEEPKKEKSKVFDFFRLISRKKVKIEKLEKKVKSNG